MLRRASKGKVALLEVCLRTQPAYVGHEAKGGELVSGTLVHLICRMNRVQPRKWLDDEVKGEDFRSTLVHLIQKRA